MNTIIIYIIYTILYIANIFISTKLNFKQPYKKPTFQPPNFIFPIVWSILYTLLFFSIQHLDLLESELNEKIDLINQLNEEILSS